MQRRFGNLDDVWPAGLARRLGAMVYDGFLVAAIWILITGLHLTLMRQVVGIPAEEIGTGLAQVLSLRFALLLGAFLFFAFFWVRGGMTLGMQAWRLRVQTLDRKSTRLNSSHVRISYAVFCLKKKKNKEKIQPDRMATDTHHAQPEADANTL